MAILFLNQLGGSLAPKWYGFFISSKALKHIAQ
jgi:hypothetical protein